MDFVLVPERSAVPGVKLLFFSDYNRLPDIKQLFL